MSAYDDLILARSGLVAFWPLDENPIGSTIVDDKNGIVASKLTAGSLYPTGGTAVEELGLGTGFSFTAANTGYFESTDTRLRLNQNAYTVEGWYRRGAASGIRTMFTVGPNGIGLQILDSVVRHYFISTVPAYEIHDRTRPADDGWHYVAISYDGATQRTRIDQVTGTRSTVRTVLWSAGSAYIGRDRVGGGDYYDGGMCKLAVYNRILTEAEMDASFLAGLADPTAAADSEPYAVRTTGPGRERVGRLPIAAPLADATIPEAVLTASQIWLDGAGSDYVGVIPIVQMAATKFVLVATNTAKTALRARVLTLNTGNDTVTAAAWTTISTTWPAAVKEAIGACKLSDTRILVVYDMSGAASPKSGQTVISYNTGTDALASHASFNSVTALDATFPAHLEDSGLNLVRVADNFAVWVGKGSASPQPRAVLLRYDNSGPSLTAYGPFMLGAEQGGKLAGSLTGHPVYLFALSSSRVVAVWTNDLFSATRRWLCAQVMTVNTVGFTITPGATFIRREIVGYPFAVPVGDGRVLFICKSAAESRTAVIDTSGTVASIANPVSVAPYLENYDILEAAPLDGDLLIIGLLFTETYADYYSKLVTVDAADALRSWPDERIIAGAPNNWDHQGVSWCQISGGGSLLHFTRWLADYNQSEGRVLVARQA